MTRLLLFMVVSLYTHAIAFAQGKQYVQIKTYDQTLQTFKNVELSLNDKGYFLIGPKGVAVVELDANDLPIKSVKIKDDKLEAASWNFSKGVIEIIIRPKSYTLVHFALRYPDGLAVPKSSVSFTGTQTVTVTTDPSGEFDLPLSLNEKVSSSDQFRVAGLQIVKMTVSDQENVIVVEYPKQELEKEIAETISKKEQYSDFDLTSLDTIQSLSQFYIVFKNISIANLNEEARLKIDAKFNQLVAQKVDSVSRNQKDFIGNISDTSYVTEDIRNLLNQASLENETLQVNRADFESKIKVIANKLEKGITNLDQTERHALLADLDRLEQLLIQNESKFYQNQNDYHQIISTLKDKYFEIRNLENRLSLAEKQRLEEQKVFRQRLLLIGGVLVVFAILIILLVSFSDRLRKQAKDLKVANEEVKTINENLEEIVVNRTRMLAESNKELDTFLYRASHDLRSPIRSILGLCNISNHITQEEYVSKVLSTTQEMDQMLEKLITISEIQQESMNRVTVKLADIINEVKEKNTQMIEESGVQFHVSCPPEISINTSPALVESILTNLIENAIFFSSIKNPIHARVEVTASLNQEDIELIVYDNGVGIDERMLPKLFNMFFTGHEMSKGNGLGLYTVHKCVRMLQGKISVESELARYTKFKIVLPLTSVLSVSRSAEQILQE